jgi:hypothetical protein
MIKSEGSLEKVVDSLVNNIKIKDIAKDTQ